MCVAGGIGKCVVVGRGMGWERGWVVKESDGLRGKCSGVGVSPDGAEPAAG